MLIKLLRNVFSESEAPKTKYKNQTNITDGHTFILTRCVRLQTESSSRDAVQQAAFDSEHDENLGLTYPKEKKLKITNYPRFAFT